MLIPKIVIQHYWNVYIIKICFVLLWVSILLLWVIHIDSKLQYSSLAFLPNLFFSVRFTTKTLPVHSQWLSFCVDRNSVCSRNRISISSNKKKTYTDSGLKFCVSNSNSGNKKETYTDSGLKFRLSNFQFWHNFLTEQFFKNQFWPLLKVVGHLFSQNPNSKNWMNDLYQWRRGKE